MLPSTGLVRTQLRKPSGQERRNRSHYTLHHICRGGYLTISLDSRMDKPLGMHCAYSSVNMFVIGVFVALYRSFIGMKQDTS